MLESADIKQLVENNNKNLRGAVAKTEQFLELLKWPYLSYKMGNDQEKREMMKITTSNFTADGKNLLIKLNKPFEMVYEHRADRYGGPTLAASRTLSALLSQLVKYFEGSADSWSLKDRLGNVSSLILDQPIVKTPKTIGPIDLPFSSSD